VITHTNVSGFVYTQTDDRMWRKNRQERDGESCVGTDVNRNWPHQWDIPGGSSPDACSETYRGESPGDSPENQVLTNHTLAVGETNGIKFFVDWHAFSQLILLPYGYSCSATIDDLDKQMELAGGVAEAIQSVNGLEFVYGPTCETIYQTAGGSNDWAYDIAGAELAWAFELRPGSGGSGGFVIPPSNILPSGEENWAGMLALFQAF
jgi:carboxypeptidase A4